MRDLAFDLRQAGRLLRRRPGFTLFSVLTLAAGIGASTLVFSLVYAALLRDLPFEDPDRLVWMYNTRTERDRAPFSMPDLEDYRRDVHTLAGIASSRLTRGRPTPSEAPRPDRSGWRAVPAGIPPTAQRSQGAGPRR
jgi:hypothetical protein